MAQVHFPAQHLAKTNHPCSVYAYLIALMAATCSKGGEGIQGSSQSGSRHHGKGLLIPVCCPELPVSQEAEVEMFMDCLFFMLCHV